MAGGYDGSKMYPEPQDMQTTVKLVNDELFEKGAEVSMHMSGKIALLKDVTCIFYLVTFHLKVTLHGWIRRQHLHFGRRRKG